ncbi:phage tail terminator protein [Otariodibacter oris]|uniref:Minor tail protein U n=1 Tax=Otariodibacter oris TaxID=1032623 RepID=A0A420XID5_9PAST|nr:phage tail terminator protein [Otariodibacter oris]QGM80720.1 phage tail protein [Otariodibacter oris]RKR77117.1 minor tail protein U [Otariodibacter oris]
MISNENIRKEVISLLRENINGSFRFYSGRPIFRDVNAELPTIAVYIDEAEYSESTICLNECDASLCIGIYLPMTSSEENLDLVAENIAAIFRKVNLSSVDDCQIRRYAYEYDPEENKWINSTLYFDINYLN